MTTQIMSTNVVSTTTNNTMTSSTLMTAKSIVKSLMDNNTPDTRATIVKYISAAGNDGRGELYDELLSNARTMEILRKGAILEKNTEELSMFILCLIYTSEQYTSKEEVHCKYTTAISHLWISLLSNPNQEQTNSVTIMFQSFLQNGGDVKNTKFVKDLVRCVYHFWLAVHQHEAVSKPIETQQDHLLTLLWLLNAGFWTSVNASGSGRENICKQDQKQDEKTLVDTILSPTPDQKSILFILFDAIQWSDCSINVEAANLLARLVKHRSYMHYKNIEDLWANVQFAFFKSVNLATTETLGTLFRPMCDLIQQMTNNETIQRIMANDEQHDDISTSIFQTMCQRVRMCDDSKKDYSITVMEWILPMLVRICHCLLNTNSQLLKEKTIRSQIFGLLSHLTPIFKCKQVDKDNAFVSMTCQFISHTLDIVTKEDQEICGIELWAVMDAYKNCANIGILNEIQRKRKSLENSL